MKRLFVFSLIILVVLSITGWIFLSKKNPALPALPEPIKIVKAEGLGDKELKERIGQMIMVGFRGTEAPENSEIYNIIKDVKVGGVVLFDYNVPLKSFPMNIESPKQVKNLIFDIQKYSKTPLFVSVDAEGGNVNRLKQRYGFLPIVSAGKMGKDSTLQTTQKESIKLAGELKNAGFNMNLAPVADVNINSKNPIIGAIGRSFSNDSGDVVKNARVFIQNHTNNNVIAVVKHFPGQGSATQDTHLGLADVSKTYKPVELEPYNVLNSENLLNVVMVGHIINKNVDPQYPATLSSIFLQDILKNQIGFKGVIISDDMQMDAINKNYSLQDSVILSINAGVDVVSVLNNSPSGYDKDVAYKVRDIIFDAVKSKKISEERIIESYNKILELKKKFEIIKPTANEIKNKNFELLQADKKYTFGEVYNIAKDVGQKTGARPALIMAVAQQELNLEKTDMCYLTNIKTGEGIRIIDNKKTKYVMNPGRDINIFLEITKSLGKDFLKTPVTCPMAFGWGGAMGPADFIPSTWMKYKGKIEKITGRPANPWNVEDSFLAMGLYLSDSGALGQKEKGEWEAAMIYFSGAINSGYNFYADGVMDIADKIQGDINIMEQK